MTERRQLAKSSCAEKKRTGIRIKNVEMLDQFLKTSCVIIKPGKK